MYKKQLVQALQKYPAVVIWGLFKYSTSCQRHIHEHLYSTLVKIEHPVIWCDDKVENNVHVPDGSLIFTSNECCKHLQYKKPNWYAMYHTVEAITECQNYIRLFLPGEIAIEEGSVYWEKTVAFHKQSHRLYQTLVTDLLPGEFKEPVFANNSSIVNWVGSIWNDQNNHGNKRVITILEEVLKKRGLEFVAHKGISNEENIACVRASRIAPAIGGDFQTTGMLPCRLWKNISYGQLGVTNLAKAVDVFGNFIIYENDIEALIDMALSIPEREYKNITAVQQEIVAKKYTYLNFIFNITRALEELGVQ
jgi:hypothetical protein